MTQFKIIILTQTATALHAVTNPEQQKTGVQPRNNPWLKFHAPIEENPGHIVLSRLRTCEFLAVFQIPGIDVRAGAAHPRIYRVEKILSLSLASN